MSDFKEISKIRFNTADCYCRYLNIDLTLYPYSTKYTGRFGKYLKKLGIDNFPFNIHLPDLIINGALKPSLYVELPRSFFDAWDNFPTNPQIRTNEYFSIVGNYSLEILARPATHLDDFLHPYNAKLKETFFKKFKTEVPKNLTQIEHSNGNKYIAAEAYLPYWQAYALASHFYQYRFAESLLSPEEGKTLCIDLIKRNVKVFINKYGEIFNRISWYKTIVNTAIHKNTDHTEHNLFILAQKNSQVTTVTLTQDLKHLLELDAAWSSQIKKHGCTVLQNTQSHLRGDIYLVYKQLRLLDKSANSLFAEFASNSRVARFTPLHQALGVEKYNLKTAFVSYGQFYCSEINDWGYNCTDQVFESLYLIAGFDAWLRAFHDLHLSINTQNKIPINFTQDRIVDALIIMSVRTEIVLREIFRSVIQNKSDESITAFLKEVQNYLNDFTANILETSRNEIKNTTKLNTQPVDLFEKTNKLKPKNFGKEKNYFLHSILKFITARNYFAHHSYKDDEINFKTSAIAAEILKSLISTLLFFHKNK